MLNGCLSSITWDEKLSNSNEINPSDALHHNSSFSSKYRVEKYNHPLYNQSTINNDRKQSLLS